MVTHQAECQTRQRACATSVFIQGKRRAGQSPRQLCRRRGTRQNIPGGSDSGSNNASGEAGRILSRSRSAACRKRSSARTSISLRYACSCALLQNLSLKNERIKGSGLLQWRHILAFETVRTFRWCSALKQGVLKTWSAVSAAAIDFIPLPQEGRSAYSTLRKQSKDQTSISCFDELTSTREAFRGQCGTRVARHFVPFPAGTRSFAGSL